MSNESQMPAFPSMDMNSHMGIDRLELRYQGLTKREYFAAMAMQGLYDAVHSDITMHKICCAHAAEMQGTEIAYSDVEKYIAHYSVKMADELLKALEQQPSK